MDYSNELHAALKVAADAGRIAMGYFHSVTDTEEKSDESPVTIADRECESFIASALANLYPDDGIVGEEGTSKPTRSGRRWLIDPIDGTRDFVRRTTFWAVQIALEVGDTVVVGVIHFPALNETAYAARRLGAWADGQRLRVSEVTRLDKAVLMVSGFKNAWEAWPPESIRYLTEQCWTVRAHSGCYDVALLARGKADIWLSGSGVAWDYAPARILAEEAGAVFLTRSGGNSIYQNHCVIVVPPLEAEIRRILGIHGGRS
jgi:fructose-1,6-bisphosphatase/inositol monophosphatase family enzyme